MQFEPISGQENLKDVISSAFDMELSVSGGWGYLLKEATVIEKTNGIPLEQLEFTLASMRCYLEMNMTIKADERFGSINLSEIAREETKQNGTVFHKVTYSVTAIKESLYNQFIEEYKQGFGKEDFDITAHFNRRKEATITLPLIHWFEVSNTL
ncbi:MAG: hypothetical protein IE885_08450 [Campylobacterales bacterium]|nr:hypothetical protein [Campylobacterales bacterium]